MSAHSSTKTTSARAESVAASGKRYFLMRSPQGGWFIFQEGIKEPLQYIRNKVVAIETIKTVAKYHAPSQVLIEGHNGTAEVRYSYSLEQTA